MYGVTQGLDMITSFAEVHEILRDRRFSAAEGRPEGRDFLGGSLVVIDGPEHLARRRIYMPLMAEAQLQHYEREVIRPILDDCERIHFTDGGDGWRHGDLVAYCRDVFMRFAAALIGLDGYDSDKTSARLYELLGPISEGVTVEWSPRDHDEILREGLAAKEAYRSEFFQPSWDRRAELVARHRRGELEREELPVDLLTLMQLSWDDAWDQDLPVRESILFLAGSTGNPVAQIAYAVEDLSGWVAAHPEDRGHLSDEAFVRHAIAETLRLHIGGSPVLVRLAKEDVTLHSTGRRIPEGHKVGLDMVAANRDPEVFGDDADVFDPYRYNRLPARVKHFGVAFGGGAHVCLGRPLVMGRDTGVDSEGFQYLTLRRLLDAGVEPDGTPRLAQSGQRHYEHFPVRLRA